MVRPPLTRRIASAGFAASDNPVERSPCRPGDRRHPAPAIKQIAVTDQRIDMALANRHGIEVNRSEQRLKAPPARGRRHLRCPAVIGSVMRAAAAV